MKLYRLPDGRLIRSNPTVLTRSQIEVINAASIIANNYIEEKVAPMLKTIQEGTKQLLESDVGKSMREQMARTGVTVKDYTERAADMPFYEGSAGLRSFLG